MAYRHAMSMQDYFSLFSYTFLMNPSTLLITHPDNLRYLTGTTAEGIALLQGKKGIFITDPRYAEEAAASLPMGWECRVRERELRPLLLTALQQLHTTTLGFEAAHLTIARLAALKQLLKGSKIRYIPTENIIEHRRLIKTPHEHSLIRKACAITTRILKVLATEITTGVTEKEIAERIRQLAYTFGADGLAFPSIVAFGSHASRPHHQHPTKYRLQPGDPIQLDLGVTYRGYTSDCSRVFFCQHISSEYQHIYTCVIQAQADGLAALHHGITCAQVDAVVRSSLAAADLDTYFTHATGHGLGLAIHESPRIAPPTSESASTDIHVLQTGMVVTIEPGVYHPGHYGMRIEDTVIITDTGHQLLTHFTKKPHIVG